MWYSLTCGVFLSHDIPDTATMAPEEWGCGRGSWHKFSDPPHHSLPIHFFMNIDHYHKCVALFKSRQSTNPYFVRLWFFFFQRTACKFELVSKSRFFCWGGSLCLTDNQLAVQDDLINDASVLKRLLYSAYLFVEIVLNEPHTSSLRQQSTQQPETRKLFAFLQFSECGSKSHPLRGIQLILCFPSHFRTRSQSAHTVNHSDKVLPSFLFNSVHLLKSSLLACGIFLLRTASVWV